jgi:FkbM family methyltransferase
MKAAAGRRGFRLQVHWAEMAGVFNIQDVVNPVSTGGAAIPMIDVVDVGAMFGGGDPPYAALVKAGIGRVVGFEPVPTECLRLNAMARKGERYLPYAIGDGTERTFYLTNKSMTSSLYEPNTRLLKRFQYLEELTQVVETSRVRTHRLDDLAEIAAMDYLKADIQGAELDMLRGAERLIQGTLVVQIEVEFLEMYKGQPLFAEIDTHLRARGFALHSFLDMQGRCFYPILVNNDPNKTWRQHIWCDVLYVRDFMRWSEASTDDLLKIAAILHNCYHSVDLAALALQHYQARTGARVWDDYIRRLMGHVPEPIPLD